MGTSVTIKKRLYLTADGSRVVAEGDPDAAFLWATVGMEVDAAEAKRLGYGVEPEPEPQPEPEPEAKMSDAPPNKAILRSENKRARKR